MTGNTTEEGDSHLKDTLGAVATLEVDERENVFASSSGENPRIHPAPKLAPVNFVIVEDGMGETPETR